MNREDKQKLALRTAVIAGMFTVIVSVLMLINFWQLKSTDPLESESLKIMVEQFQKDASNQELQEEIRKLDLVVRNAYFTRHWQIRTGAALLLAGAIILVVALRIYYALKSTVDVPASTELGSEMELLVSRRWVLFTVVFLFALSLLAAFLSQDYLSETPVLALEEESNEPPIQEIVVKTAAESKEAQNIEATPDEKPKTGEETNTAEDKTDAVVQEPVSTNNNESVKAAAAYPSHADLLSQFPSFRGPYGLGLSNRKNIPTDWDGASGKNILWKAAIPGSGYNSPVIWGNQLFLTGANQSNQSVYCYDLNSGSLLWQHDIQDIPRTSTQVPKVTDDTGYAAPSAATDGQHVFAIFATGDVVCLDMQGKRIWGKNLGLPDNHYGHSSSLLVWREFLYIQFDTNKAGKVMALDPGTGNTKWETPRTSKISWASPILANTVDGYQLILTSAPFVSAYDPVTGAEKWSVDCLSGEVGPSAGFSDGVVFAANEYAKLVAIRPGTNPEILWESDEYLPEVSSPVATNGLVFIGTSYGVVACFDVANGEMLWEYESDEGFYASPMIADGKLYFLDMDGKMHIFSVSKEMKLLGKPELGEGSVCTPAFTEGRIYLRSRAFLYCIGEK